eukprot:scaffold68580_cov48-Phaeocystis_antarctica.AAC.2
MQLSHNTSQRSPNMNMHSHNTSQRRPLRNVAALHPAPLRGSASSRSGAAGHPDQVCFSLVGGCKHLPEFINLPG